MRVILGLSSYLKRRKDKRRHRDTYQLSLARIRVALAALVAVFILGSMGYIGLGFTPLEAAYQTVTTVVTVGFREVHPLSAVGQIFTIALIMVGTGTVLYNMGVLAEAFTEGHMRQHLERRRMNNKIRNMSGHVIICGMGRTGRSAAQHLKTVGHEVVVLDRDATRCAEPDTPFIVGNVTGDEILMQAGIERASALIATLDTDAETVYLVLSARAMRPDMTIVARAHDQPSRQKLLLAGATRVLNPQVLGGRRAATFAVQPHVAEFIDAVLHDEDIDIRIQEVMVHARSPLAGRPLNSFDVFGEQAVSLLAVHRHAAGEFSLNPSHDTVVAPNDVLIVFGTPDQIAALEQLNGN